MKRAKHTNHVRGSHHHRWNDGPMFSEDGYVKERVGVGHPLADPKGYAYQHLVVWRAAGKRLPKAHEILHHLDEDKTNNRLDNLELITRKRHSELHAAESERDERGRFARKAA